MTTDLIPKKLGWEPYIYLVYLSFLFFQPLYEPGNALDWVLIGLMIALFLPVYFWTWRAPGKRALWGVAGMTLLGALSTPLNPGASSFYIYAAAAAAFTGPPRFAAKVVGVIFTLGLLSAAFSGIPWPYWLAAFAPALIFVPIIGGVNIFQAEKARANAKLRLAHDEISRLAKVAERERIARDLHDLLGHTLSSITLKSELASRLALADPVRAEREMREVAQVSRGALKEVREAVSGYRARNLAGELTHAREMLAATGVRLEYFAEPLNLPPVQEGTLALALREAVTNVVRHAHASVCMVRLLRVGDEVRLEVVDNGLGKCAPDGAGLSGMGERAELLGGRLGGREKCRGDTAPVDFTAGRKTSCFRRLTRKPGRMIRIVIAEDQGMVLGALAALLEAQGRPRGRGSSA